MKQGSRAFLRIRLTRWSLVATLSMALIYLGVIEFFRTDPSADEAQVYMVRQGHSLGQPHLRSHASAWEERRQLEPSIRSLERIKHPSPQQQRQLQQLQQRHHLLSRIEDYELRLALRAKDPALDLSPIRQKLRELRQEVKALEAPHE